MTQPTGAGSAAEFTSFAEVLELRAARQPEDVAYRFVIDGEEEEIEWTYGVLIGRARCLAALLREQGAVGERVLLCYPWGVEYIISLFACFLSGAIAVPHYPPRPNRGWQRLGAVAVDAEPLLALSTAEVTERARADLGGGDALGRMRWLVLGGEMLEARKGWTNLELDSDSLALVQYTSGTTAAPKGVRVRHGNLLHNLAALVAAGSATPLESAGGWIPFFHDMGLVGLLLLPVHQGKPCTLLAPEAFLYRPLRWLRMITRHRINWSPSPSFGYSLCARHARREKLEGLDLSSWQVAFIGAECIDPRTIRGFSEVFGPLGFRPETFFPGYGLAESTLYTTGTARTSAPSICAFDRQALEAGMVKVAIDRAPGTVELVSCGSPAPGASVEIVEPNTYQLCGSGEVGEIWTAGPSVADGYWGQPELSEEVFTSRLAEADSRRFLRTGDLGFWHGGDLFISGRIKDLVIIGGRNLYSEDIEMTVEACHPAFRSGGCIAFSVKVQEAESLVVVVEVNRRWARVAGEAGQQPEVELREAVVEEHEVSVSEAYFVRPHSLPRTSSGKKCRRACRTALLRGEIVGLDLDYSSEATPWMPRN